MTRETSPANPRGKPVLLVGFGLAGMLLSWFLDQRDIPWIAFDDRGPGASTPLAAGIINPLGGRIPRPAPHFAAFFAFARETYQAMEHRLSIPLWDDRIVQMLLTSPEDALSARLSESAYAAYRLPASGAIDTAENILRPFGSVSIQGAGQLRVGDFTAAMKSRSLHRKRLREEAFQYGKLEGPSTESRAWTYQGMDYCAVVFCEGYRAAQNPWLQHLPWRPNRGERLLLEIPDLNLHHLLKRQGFLAPVSHHSEQRGTGKHGAYWLGSTNSWSSVSLDPDALCRRELIAQYEAMCNLPARIVNQGVGIRPALRDRRPLTAAIPGYPGLFVFNGLGSKGSLLGPVHAAFLSRQLEHYILAETAGTISSSGNGKEMLFSDPSIRPALIWGMDRFSRR